MPALLRVPFAFEIRTDAPPEPAWSQGSSASSGGADLARLAVPVLERFDPQGDVTRERDDFGLSFPLAALD